LQLLVSDLELSAPLIEEKNKIATETEYLENAIHNLPAFLKEVTILHYHKCFSVNQIAHLINKPESLVQGWLAHSIYWLKIFVLKFKPPE
jgi:DNA-directed RNA polymerase specialized sigma24 family protein